MMRRHPRTFRSGTLVAIAGLSLLAGCSAESYRKSADTEVYGVIGDLQQEVYGETRPFTIEPEDQELRTRLLEKARDAFAKTQPVSNENGIEGNNDEGPAPLILDLVGSLEVAAENSRNFQSEKERVYLSVLDLTFQRYLFTNRYFGTIDADYDRVGGGESGDTTRTRGADAQAGFERSLATGGRMVLSFATELIRRITGFGGSDTNSSSLLSLSLTQPLLRGAGKKIALEPLTQSERDAIYSLREFDRTRIQLAIQIARQFYTVVERQLVIVNENSNRHSRNESYTRTQSLADFGRTPQFEVDQAEQQVLSAQNRVIVAEESYQRVLDQFKLDLGLPTDSLIDLASSAIADIKATEELEPLDLNQEVAVEIALANRRDHRNTIDRVEDARRRVDVAADALRAGLDFSGSLNLGTDPDKPLDFSLDESSYNLGINLDLPIDRVQERNAYRSSLIALEQAKRAAEASEDRVKLEVRDSLRSLNQSRETYEIQRNSVKLAEDRVASTVLLQEYGRVRTRDVLEAQDSLVQAQNALINAITNYRTIRLELLGDMGVLRLGEVGLTYSDDFAVIEEERLALEELEYGGE